ncbi:MAG: tetratricopeptide repeat protein [Bdellovibrionota bacterium]
MLPTAGPSPPDRRAAALVAFLWLVLLAGPAGPARAQEGVQPGAEGARELIRRWEVEAAHKHLVAHLQQYPRDAEAQFELGKILLSYEPPLYEKAIEHIEFAVEKFPDRSDCRLWLARAYGMKLEHSNLVQAAFGPVWKVKNNFEKAVELDPGSAPARVDVFQFYLFAPGLVGGGKDKALEQIEALKKTAPDSSLLHTALAILALKDKDYSKAQAAFERIAELEPPKAGQSYFQMGVIYLSAGQYDLANKYLKKAWESGTPIEPPFQVLLPGYVRNAFYEKAKYEIEHGVKVAVDSDSLSVSDRMSRREDERDPKYARLIAAVGKIYERNKRPKLAKLYLDRARQLGFSPPTANAETK